MLVNPYFIVNKHLNAQMLIVQMSMHFLGNHMKLTSSYENEHFNSAAL